MSAAICKKCGKEFKQRKRYDASRSDQEFCSRSCYQSYRAKHAGEARLALPCDRCGKILYRWPSQINDSGNYCSKSCANGANHAVAQERRNRPVPSTTKKCFRCGKEFQVFPYRQKTAKYCSQECHYEHRRAMMEGKHAHPRLKVRPTAFRHLPRICAICGFDVVVSVHHIVPKSEGGSDDIDNLIVLCPNHHAMADRDLISRERLSQLNRALAAQQSETLPPSHPPQLYPRSTSEEAP